MTKTPGLYAPDGSYYITQTDGAGNVVPVATLPVDAGAVQTLTAGQQAQARANMGATGNLIAFTVFTASGTWTKSTNGKAAFVEVKGAGGGGGGVSNAIGYLSGTGGGEGGTSYKYVASPGSTETVTVGTGGAGGANTGGNGVAGGNSSFGTWASSGGGAGGNGFNASGVESQGGAAGTGVVGDHVRRGSAGFVNNAIPAGTIAISGSGGGQGGGNAVIANNPGNAGVNGGGGSGAASAQFLTNAAAIGGAGGNGYVIVWEYA